MPYFCAAALISESNWPPETDGDGPKDCPACCSCWANEVCVLAGVVAWTAGVGADAPSIASIVRTEVPDEASSEIRAVEDYSLVFSSMQEP